MSSRRFIIVADNPPVNLQDQLTELLRKRHESSHWGWWHRYPHMWLIKTPDLLDAERLRDEIRSGVPGINFVVFEFSGRWAGFGDVKKFEWFHSSFT